MEDGLVRFGILGCAYIARKLSRAIMQTEGVDLYAIGSRSIEKAQVFAKNNGFPSSTKIYGSYESVLEDEAVDAVYMPLPTSIHVEWALKASAKKKHILIEKPAALCTEDFDRIILACESEGVQLMDGTMWVHHPRTAKMKELLKQDLLGNILEVHTSFFVPMSASNPKFFAENIRINADLDALGALGDLGWYCARAILWAYDYNLPESIVALPGAQLMKGGVITRCSASFVWEDGRVALLHCSFHANMTMSCNIYGSKGTLEVQDFVIPYTENHASFKIRSAVGNKEPMDVSNETNQTQESLMILEFANIVKGIKSGKGGLDPSWPAITRKTQQVIDAIKLSIQKGYTKIYLKK